MHIERHVVQGGSILYSYSDKFCVFHSGHQQFLALPSGRVYCFVNAESSLGLFTPDPWSVYTLPNMNIGNISLLAAVAVALFGKSLVCRWNRLLFS